VSRPRVLLVVGAYYPELSGGAVQIRQLVRTLADRVECVVLTTSAVKESGRDEVDGVPVHRIFVDVSSRRSTARAAIGLASTFVRLASAVDLVQINGFSRKSVLLMLLAWALRKRRVVKLTSVGDDDPPAIRARGRVPFAAYRRADVFVGTNPRQRELCSMSGIPPERFVLIPNGVDCVRFRPPAPGERALVRAKLGLPAELPLTLFVGFFSREKQPHVLYEAWRRLSGERAGGLVFVGATRSRYHEVDPTLADGIRAAACDAGVDARLTFIERTDEIEEYYRAADIFALPSTREGMPNALLEAMASGLPCVASRLPGVTDWLVEDGVSGVLVTPGDAAGFASALGRLHADAAYGARLGDAARASVESRFAIEGVARMYLALYARLRTP